jgi:hypothetical protein
MTTLQVRRGNCWSALMLYVVTEPALTVPGYAGPVGRDLIAVRRLLMRDLKATLESMVTNKAELVAVRSKPSSPI